MLLLTYDARPDLRNRASSPELTLTGRHQPSAPETPTRSVSLATSYDDGATWTDQTLRTNGSGYVATPHGTGLVSLRVRAEDAAGNGIVQQVTRVRAALIKEHGVNMHEVARQDARFLRGQELPPGR